MATFQSLPGFREFYPDDFARRKHIFDLWRRTAHAFGFAEYDAPVLEPLELYKAKSGDEIEGQLFSFTDKGGREVALRPEMTPTVCRLVGAKASALKRPIKWFSIAEFYRYERAQKGRQRAFFQFNADIFGEPGPEAEIELIALLIQTFTSFGLTEQDFQVRLSDRDLWVFYLEALGLDEPRVHAMLGVIDKYEKQGEAAFMDYADKFGTFDSELKSKVIWFLQIKSLQELEMTVPRLADARVMGTKEVGIDIVAKLTKRIEDWRQVINGLSMMGLHDFVQVDLSVVRGLAYYTGFVFEAFDRKGDLRALAGGGRYNDLIKKLGGPDLPAIGFAIGDVTTGLLLEQRGKMPTYVSMPDVFVIIDGERGRLNAFPCIHELRAAGYRVEYSLKAMAIGKQFKAATDSGAKVALIYGGDELAKGVVKIRDLTARNEREVPRVDVLAAVRDFFSA